jgi:hypothetical protein
MGVRKFRPPGVYLLDLRFSGKGCTAFGERVRSDVGAARWRGSEVPLLLVISESRFCGDGRRDDPRSGLGVRGSPVLAGLKVTGSRVSRSGALGSRAFNASAQLLDTGRILYYNVISRTF